MAVSRRRSTAQTARVGAAVPACERGRPVVVHPCGRRAGQEPAHMILARRRLEAPLPRRRAPKAGSSRAGASALIEKLLTHKRSTSAGRARITRPCCSRWSGALCRQPRARGVEPPAGHEPNRLWLGISYNCWSPGSAPGGRRGARIVPQGEILAVAPNPAGRIGRGSIRGSQALVARTAGASVFDLLQFSATREPR